MARLARVREGRAFPPVHLLRSTCAEPRVVRNLLWLAHARDGFHRHSNSMAGSRLQHLHFSHIHARGCPAAGTLHCLGNLYRLSQLRSLAAESQLSNLLPPWLIVNEW